MNRRRVIYILDWMFAVVLITASAKLAHYYFTWDPIQLKTLKEAQLLYTQPTTRWLKPDLTTTTAQWETTIPLNEFDQMVFNAALARYNLQTSAPLAYSRLLEAYRHGLWNGDFTDELTPKIEELTRRWKSARTTFLKSGDATPEPKLAQTHNAGFAFEFPRGTPTSHVGTLLEISFEAEPGSAPQTAADIFWSTQNHFELTAQRAQTVPVTLLQSEPDGRKTYRVLLDLASNAEWLTAGSQAGLFNVRPTLGEVKWKAASVRFRDSTKLPLSQPEGR